jgi:hypothetical protein
MSELYVQELVANGRGTGEEGTVTVRQFDP